MANDSKISFDVEISSDGQNQINQFSKSFDGLRDSLNRLSNPFYSLSNNFKSLDNDISKVTDSINKLNSQNQELLSNGDKTTNKISELSTSFSTWGSVIKYVTSGLKAWEIALTAGLAIVTTFLPEIIFS